jgi:hypothetical protein
MSKVESLDCGKRPDVGMSEASQEIMQEAMEAAISTDQEEMTSK